MNVAQLLGNASAAKFGQLTWKEMLEIGYILGRRKE